MEPSDTSHAIESARAAAGLSQRQLQDCTGISQSTLSRILSGERVAKVTELVSIAAALGCPVSRLTNSAVADRVRCAARVSNNSSAHQMRQRLLYFVELDAYLDGHEIPEAG